MIYLNNSRRRSSSDGLHGATRLGFLHNRLHNAAAVLATGRSDWDIFLHTLGASADREEAGHETHEGKDNRDIDDKADDDK